MDVAAFLPSQLLGHLKVVLGSEHRLIAAGSWAEFRTAVQQGGIDLIIADPIATGVAEVDTLEFLRRQFPSLPVVVYTSVAPTAMRAIVRLAKIGIDQVVLSRFDDEPRSFRVLLEGIRTHALSDRMFEEMAGAFSCLPIVVVRAIEQLFRVPERFQDVQDLAAAAGMNLRTLYRNLEAGGIFSPRALVVSARLLQAYGYLQDPGRSMKEVAGKMGYHSPWQLSQHMKSMTGRSTDQVRREVSGETLVGLLAEQIKRRRRKAE